MSDVHQLGHHPDADQISAFVEQALPAHERKQMFDHLAVCAECRELVALSLPAIEEPEPVKPVAASARRPWWSGWNLALPAAAVLAGLSAFVLYIHNSASAPNASPQPPMATLREPAAPAPEARPPAGTLKASPHLSAAEKPANNIAPSENETRGVAGQKSNAAPVAGMQRIPVQGRNPGQSDALMEAPPTLKSTPAVRLGTASGAGAAGGVGVGTTIGADANTLPSGQASLQKAAQADAEAKALPPPAPAANPQCGGTSESVNVIAGAHAMETESSPAAGAPISLDALQTTPFIQLKNSLPSRKAVLSMATQGRLMVAIDLDNAVFVSKDAGKHWKPTAAPWPGHAVKASLVSFAPASRAAFTMDKAASIGGPLRTAAAPASMDQPVNAPPPAPAPGASVAGTVTDATGAVIAGATVEVANSATNAAHIATTDGTGRYLVNGLAPGSYRVEARARGFESRVLPAVAVTAGRSTVADLTLTVASSSQTVTVEAQSIRLPEANADQKTAKKIQPSQLFEITTDNGERWTSVDGVTWQHN
jgi:Carboxypeptidase regulatory-like domain